MVWPKTKITLRGDSHFSTPEVHDLCDGYGIDFILGQAINKKLKALGEPLMELAAALAEQTDEPVRLFDSFDYRAGSWSRPRIIIYKAEITQGKTNPRFVVTNIRNRTPKFLYEKVYCARGRMEGFIKNHKTFLHSDRTSCHRFPANQFRLFLHSAAYVPNDPRSLTPPGTYVLLLHRYGDTRCQLNGSPQKAKRVAAKKNAPSRARVRVTIGFSPDTYGTLERIARDKKVSLAWVVRDAMDMYLAEKWPLFSERRQDAAPLRPVMHSTSDHTRQKETGAYYTPPAAVAALVKWAARRASDRLLDPSCGDGRFIALQRRSVGVEQEAETSPDRPREGTRGPDSRRRLFHMGYEDDGTLRVRFWKSSFHPVSAVLR